MASAMIVRGASASPSAACAAGFAADLAWERCQEQAAIAFRAGDAITPTRLWATGLDIAQRHFGRGDPRLASSLSNQALVMRRDRQEHQAQRLFRDALEVWDDSWAFLRPTSSFAQGYGVPRSASTPERSVCSRAAPSSRCRRR